MEKVKKAIPDYEPIPLQSRRGVITADNLMQSKLGLNKIQLAYPVVNSEQRILPYNIGFTWSEAVGAAYYKIKIAKDENMTDIVKEEITKYNYYTLDDELDVGEKYYWQVEGIVDSRAMDMTPSLSGTAYFYTYTYEEAAAVAELDTSVYDEKLLELKKLYDGIVEADGSDISTYKQGTRAEIDKLFNESAGRIEKYALQREIEKETSRLELDFYDILNRNKNSLERTYSVSDISMWSVNEERGEVTVNGDEAVIKSKLEGNGTTIAHDNRILAQGEAVKIKMNFGDMANGWEAFGIKQVETEGKNMITGAKGYYIVAKTDLIELQRYPSNGIICSVDNDSTFIKPNTWHDIEVSCTPEGENNRIVLKVDGTTVIDYLDTEAQIYEMGYFSIQAFKSGIKFK